MSAPTGRGTSALIVAVVLLSAASLVLGSYDFARASPTVTSTQTTATTLTQTSVSTSTVTSAGRTITVMATGVAQGQFDQAVVAASAASTNSSVSVALQTIQSRVSKATADLQSAGLTTAQSSLGVFSIGTTAIFGNGTFTKAYDVSEPITFTLTSTPSALNTEVAQMAQILLDDGLSSSTSLSSMTITLEFSNSATASLTSLAYKEAVLNATSLAGGVASAEGVKLLGQVSVTQVPNQQGAASLLSLLLSSLTATPSSAGVTVTVQATYAVSS